MAKLDDKNAEADRLRVEQALSAVPQPNRATRRKIEARGDAVPVTTAVVEAENAAQAAPASAELADAAEAAVDTAETLQDADAATEPAAAVPMSPDSNLAQAEAATASIDFAVPATVPASPEPSADAQPNALNTFLPVFSIKDMTMDMNTNFSGFQTAMTEAQAKAKAAFEKSSSAMGEVSEFTKGNVEAMVESGKIFAEGCQEIGSAMVAESRTAFETMTGDIKELAAAKSPTDFLKIQSDMLRKNFDTAVAYGSKNSETFLKLMSDAAAPLSGRVSLAVEKVRQTATTPAAV